MAHMSSFELKSADDFFYQMVIPQHEEFIANNASSRHALLTTILGYHLFEWVHGKKFNEDLFLEKYPSHASMVTVFEQARNITNGTKHFKSKDTTTKTQRGFSSAFSPAFAKPLNVIYTDGTSISADEFLGSLVAFWKEQKANGAF